MKQQQQQQLQKVRLDLISDFSNAQIRVVAHTTLRHRTFSCASLCAASQDAPFEYGRKERYVLIFPKREIIKQNNSFIYECKLFSVWSLM